MEVFNVLGSPGWIVDLKKFISILDSCNTDMYSLQGCIVEEYTEEVFKGIKQLSFWRKKFASKIDKRTALMVCIGPSGLLQPKVNKIYDLVANLVGPENIKSLYYPDNQNIIGFNLSDPEAVHKVRQGVSFVDEALLYHINSSMSNVHDIRVLWAPAFYPLDKIKGLFDKYATHLIMDFEEVKVKDGVLLPSNIAKGRITLRDGISIEELPHIVKLPGTISEYVLIISRDRPPICLKCREVGHIRRQCSQIKCTVCYRQHLRDSPCLGPSYSQAVRQFVAKQNPPFKDLSCAADLAKTTILTQVTELNTDIESRRCTASNVLPSSGVEYHTVSTNLVKQENMKDADTKEISNAMTENFHLVSRRITRSMNKKDRASFHGTETQQEIMSSKETGLFDSLCDEMDQLLSDEYDSEGEKTSKLDDPELNDEAQKTEALKAIILKEVESINGHVNDKKGKRPKASEDEESNKRKRNNGDGNLSNMALETGSLKPDGTEASTMCDTDPALENQVEVVYKILLQNLSMDVDNDDLDALLKPYDFIKTWFYEGYDQAGASFSTAEKASKTLELNGITWMNNKITVIYRGSRPA